MISPTVRRLPTPLKPLLRFLYEIHFGVICIVRSLVNILYRHPLFQARCTSIGRNVRVDNLPFVSGHPEIHIGNDVCLGGNLFISCARLVEKPQLIIKDRAQIGWNVELSVSRELVIEEDARVASFCRVSDSDGHPRQADLRAQNKPVDMCDIRPVRICRYAWVGHSCHIMKGVTIGEGAVIASNSVVISDVPAYSLAMGNPAEVYFRGFGRPSRKSTAVAANPAGGDTSPSSAGNGKPAR